MSSNVWVVTIDYDENGYVKDDDAGKINYDELLVKMQKSIAENNKARRKKVILPSLSVGWAAPPVMMQPRTNFIGRSSSSSRMNRRIP